MPKKPYNQRLRTAKKRKPKKKKWTSKEADKAFSLWIRERDGNRCLNCGRESNLTNSHYWGRRHSSTRYDPDNCITLCWLPCHKTWEHEKQGRYREFMLERLGENGYNKLKERANSIMKRTEALQECKQLLFPENDNN